MSRYKNEVRSIQVILKGSKWVNDPETKTILDEYQRIIDANTVKGREKRAALQILFSSRAIDTLLAHIVRNDCVARRQVPQQYYTLEASLSYLRNVGLLPSKFLDQRTYDDLCRNVKEPRNKYLHTAGIFPTDIELSKFLWSTINGMRVVSRMK